MNKKLGFLETIKCKLFKISLDWPCNNCVTGRVVSKTDFVITRDKKHTPIPLSLQHNVVDLKNNKTSTTLFKGEGEDIYKVLTIPDPFFCSKLV